MMRLAENHDFKRVPLLYGAASSSLFRAPVVVLERVTDNAAFVHPRVDVQCCVGFGVDTRAALQVD